jgi:hypothetical protein
MAFNIKNQRGQGVGKTSKGYVYFVWDRKTGNFGIYRYLTRLCHEFSISYEKTRLMDFGTKEFIDDGRYVIAGAALEVRGLGKMLQGYKTGLNTLYKGATKTAFEKQRLEDLKKFRMDRHKREGKA